VCVRRGNPRFSLYWEGDADLDLHVLTPNGYEIYYSRPTSGDGGRLDVDRIPQAWGQWMENVFWPPDGSAPRGTYRYWVFNFRGEASSFTLRTYQVSLCMYNTQLTNKRRCGRTGCIYIYHDDTRCQSMDT
jgi:uncharacterized protein YfaP (DUF2135 family)